MIGRTLGSEKTGDTADWIEIARNGDYSLIVRSDFINVNQNRIGEVGWQGVPFGSTNAYKGSTLQSKINDWFNGLSAADSLGANARLRSFTVANNAVSTLGTGAGTNGSLSNGFSKPSDKKARTGNDVAFALSFTEAANFMSKEYASLTGGGAFDNSGKTAVANFGKLKSYAKTYGLWLRSPGSSAGTAGFMFHQAGSVFQINAKTDMALIYPALWVHQDIFE